VHANGGVLPSRKTIAQWADDFHQRRRRDFTSLGDPFPPTFRHVFTGVQPGTYTYFDPSTCRTGTVVVGR
jgi:hypothetical protein